MLDAKYFQEKFPELEEGLRKRYFDVSELSRLKELSTERKKLIQEVERLKSERNQASKQIGVLKGQAKSNPSAEKEANEKMAEMKQVGVQIKDLDSKLSELEGQFQELGLRLPNLPHSSVPVGKDEKANQEIRCWGAKPEFSFAVKDHVEIGEKLRILDFERAVKLSGARFSVYFGAGAALERALIQFMLDIHTTQHGYQEVITPFLVNRDPLIGTGQLPKFEEDLFKTQLGDREFFLIPTAEVTLTNLFAGEIVQESELPKYFAAYSPCFRSEAGSYGKDVRGLFRQHQFQKVEMVKLVHPEHSFDELEKMVQNAEKILQLLELPYRVCLLSTGDMSFSSAKTFDLEVWLPGQNQYREISSCSNCTDFQARRAKMRFRGEKKDKPRLLHTLNGSGLAVGRTLIAILENFQDKEGNVRIPKILQPYLKGKKGFEEREGDLWITH